MQPIAPTGMSDVREAGDEENIHKPVSLCRRGWACLMIHWTPNRQTERSRIHLSMMRRGFWFGQLVGSGITCGEGEERIMLKLKFTCRMVGGSALWELRVEMGLRLNIQQIFTKHLPFSQHWSSSLWRSLCCACVCTGWVTHHHSGSC